MSNSVNDNLLNSTKKRGRPRAFDPVEALDAAVLVFWEKGFDGASLDDLTGAMGINRPSLYKAFGDKEALFIKALIHYRETEGRLSRGAFEKEEEIEAAVRAFLLAVLEGQVRNLPEAPGCLLVNCASTVTTEMPEVAQILDETFCGTQEMITRRFSEEIDKGALPSDFPVVERARLLVDFMNAQAVRIRAGEDPSGIEAEVPQKVRLVLS